MSESMNLIAEGWITTDQASALTGYKPVYIRILLKQGKIRGIKVGRNWLVHRESIQDYKDMMDRLGSQKHSPYRKEVTR